MTQTRQLRAASPSTTHAIQRRAEPAAPESARADAGRDSGPSPASAFAQASRNAAAAIQRREGPTVGQVRGGGGGGGGRLPDDVRGQMEQSFGTDFSSVRVHQGGEAAALGAQAYAQGENLHFAPGRYNPGSASGRELIGHELAHVVQQRAGRVSQPQGKGAGPYANVNADKGLEAEADRAGAAAAAGARASVSGHAHGSSGVQARSEGAPIQGNFGFEIEVGGGDGWRAAFDKKGGPVPDRAKDPETDKTPKLPPKGFAIVARDGFQLQAEDSGKVKTVEFVTDAPGLASPEDFENTLGSVVDLAQTLAQRNNGEAFNASEIGGAPSIKLTPGTTLTGSLQATAGVPLAAIPSLFTAIKAAGWEGGDNMQFAVNGARNSLDGIGANVLEGGEASAELFGFVAMLKYYIMLGSDKQRRSFPKGMFNVMSRTDFKTLFSMIPEAEQGLIVEHMEEWVTAVTGQFNAQQPVINQVFNYDETGKTDAMSIETTREEWLTDMPEHDRLTMHDHKPEDLRRIAPKERKKPVQQVEKQEVSVKQARKLQDKIEGLYEGIGAYKGKTDDVQYDGDQDPTRAVILELRNPPTLADPGTWTQTVRDVFGVVVGAIKEGGYGRDYVDVQSDRQNQLREEQGNMKHVIGMERAMKKLQDLMK